MDVSSYSTSRGLGVANIHCNESGSNEDGSDEDLHQLKHFRRKFQGSAVYSSKCDWRWKEKYPSIQPIKSDPYAFLCNVCLKGVSCEHMTCCRNISQKSRKSNQTVI